MMNASLVLVALVAAVMLGGAGGAAAAAAAGALAKPPKCAKVPSTKFQAATTSMLTLCPEPKEGSCPDDCVSALTTVSPTAVPAEAGLSSSSILPQCTDAGHNPCSALPNNPNTDPHIQLHQPLVCSWTMNAPWQSRLPMQMPSWRMWKPLWRPCEQRAGTSRAGWIATCEQHALLRTLKLHPLLHAAKVFGRGASLTRVWPSQRACGRQP